MTDEWLFQNPDEHLYKLLQKLVYLIVYYPFNNFLYQYFQLLALVVKWF